MFSNPEVIQRNAEKVYWVYSDIHISLLGIEVYLKSMHGSKLKAFRGVVTIETFIDAIMSIFRNIPEHTKLFYTCSEHI